MLQLVVKHIWKKVVTHGDTTQHFTLLSQPLKITQLPSLSVDLPGFLSPCIFTSTEFRPDMLLSTANNILYTNELTVGFETNIDNNASRKYEKYHSLKQ